MKVPEWYQLPPPDFTHRPDKPLTTRRFLWLAMRHRFRFVIICGLLALLSLLLMYIPPFLARKLIDQGIAGRDESLVVQWTVVLVAATILIAALHILRHRWMTKYRTALRVNILRGLQQRIIGVGAPITRRVSGGEAATVAAPDLDTVARLYTVMMLAPAGSLVLIVGTVLLWNLNWLMAIVFTGSSLLVVVAVSLLTKHNTRHTQSYREQQGVYSAHGNDVIAGLGILKGIGGQAKYEAMLARDSEELCKRGLLVMRRNALLETVTHSLSPLLAAIYVAVAAWGVATRGVTLGQMVQTLALTAEMATPLRFVIGDLALATSGWSSAERIAALLRLERDVHDLGTVALPDDPLTIVDERSGLQVQPGQCLGIAAESPADALAVVDRVARFAPDNDATPVTVNGRPIQEYALSQLRSRIGVSDSQAYFFSGTVRQLLTSDEPVDDARLHAVLDAAHAHDVVQGLPAGLDTFLPSGATTISGGQRQRLRLARALVINPDVLILIEPTSALDATTETHVAHKVAKLRHGATTVVVSTSPLVLSACDEVVLLDATGQVAARGTHADLCAKNDQGPACPAYRALVLRDSALESTGDQR